MAEILKFLIEVSGDRAEAAVERFTSKIENVSKTTEKVGGVSAAQMAAVGASIAAAGVAIGGALLSAGQHVATFGSQLHDTAQRTGITVEQLSGLAFAAKQSGASMEDLVTGMRFLSKNAVAATDSTSQQAEAFKQLGVHVRNSNGSMKDAHTLALEVADAFGGMEEGVGKTALAVQVLGRGGAALLPMFEGGAAGVKKMTDQLEAMGGVMSTKTADAADRLGDAEDALEASLDALAVTVGSALVPAMTDLAEALIPVASAMTHWISAHPDAIRLVGALAVALTGSGGLLVGLAGVKVALPLIANGLTLLGASGGALFGAVTGFAALAAIVWTFRTEIATGFLQSLSFILDGVQGLTGTIANLAGKVGLTALSDALHSVEFSIQTSRDKVMGMSLELQHSTGEVIGNTAAVDALASAHKKAAPIIDDMTKAVDGLLKKLTEAKLGDDALGKAIGIAEKQHVSATEVIETFGKAMKESEDRAVRTGSAINNAFLPYLAMMHAQEDMKDIQAALTKGTEEFNTTLDKEKTALDDAITRATQWQMITQDMKGFPSTMTDPFQTLGMTTPSQAGGFMGPELPYDRMLKMQDDLRKKNDDAVKSIKDSAGRVFDDMFIKGQNVFTSLRNALKGGALSLGRSIFEDISGALLGPVKKAFDDFFKGVMGGSGLSGLLGNLGKSMGGGLSKLLGIGGAGASAAGAAGAAGTTAGGTAGMGTTIGALATNPITIAAAAAIAGAFAIHHFAGKGRRTANEFVQEVENPFGSNMAGIVDAFDNSKKAGRLTLEDAEKSRDALTQLWAAYKEAGTTFGGQGKTEAKVVSQSMEHLQDLFGNNLTNVFEKMDTTIDALRNGTGDTAADKVAKDAATGALKEVGPIAGLPQTGFVTSASTIFAKAVDKFVDAVGAGGTSATPAELTVNLSVNNEFHVDGSGVSAEAIRDTIIPQITTVLETGVRGVREKWAQIIGDSQDGLISKTVPAPAAG